MKMQRSLAHSRLGGLGRRLLSHAMAFGLAFFLAGNTTALAAPLNYNISNIPLDVQEGVEPNIVYTLDDSGSMVWMFLPDGIGGNFALSQRAFSSTFNLIYYNPAVTYTPAVNEYGVSMGNASPTAAWQDGISRNNGTADLTTNFQLHWDGFGNDYTFGPPQPDGNPPRPAPGPAFYFYFDTTRTYAGTGQQCDITNATHVDDGNLFWGAGSDTCYTQVVITPGNAPFPGGPNRTDCADPLNCTYAEEIQNFANWYSYYRSRRLLAKTATTLSFSRLGTKVRVGYQTLNLFTNIGVVREFSGANRTAFFNWLESIPETDTGTPLQAAYDRAGRKYQESGINSPYAKVPGGSQPGDGTEYTCRQNFHIAFTDGTWNNTNVFTNNNPNNIGDEDDETHTFPLDDQGNPPFGVVSYDRRAPYRNPQNQFLGDIAFYYWAHDLRPDLTNNVPTFTPFTQVDYDNDGNVDNDDIFWNPQNNPAMWQHMVTFPVSMGLAGNRVFDPDDPYGQNGGGGDWPALRNGTLAWGNNRVDDLWHSAITGRGVYSTASNPQQLVASLNMILDNISKRKGSGAAPATSFPLYAAGTFIYQPRFDTADWTGDLLAIDVTTLPVGITTESQLVALATWSAAAQLELKTPASRNIYTWDPDSGSGIRFAWNAMPPGGVLQTWLGTDENGNPDALGSNRVAYFRGDRSEELSNGGNFRNRRFLLGDLINSTPVYVGAPYRFYPDSFEAVPYRNFRLGNETRTPRIYVGSNDGMLHGFDGATGDEVMAYVPSAVVRYLPLLAANNYTHRFYADGSPTEADVFFGGSWRTVLVAGLNAGGQGIYALDVTDGNYDGTSSDAQNHVLWEFTDLDDADLGFTFAKPRIAKTNLSSGQWAVFVGNGYNNTFDDTSIGGQLNPSPATQGRAILFVLDMETGAVIEKMDTGVGAAQDPTGQNRPNGLSTVETVDINGDRKVDLVYAGDLFGNLWKFDVRDNASSQWKVERLFTATYDNGGTTEYQPITAPPRVIAHPNGVGEGVIVLFGTGKHFELSDLNSSAVQTVYGVWDRLENNTTTYDRGALYQQQILGVSTVLQNGSPTPGLEARITTQGGFDWYTGNGTPPPSATTYLGWYMDLVEPGEKMVKEMLVRSGRLIFVTDTPSPDPCQNGGTSWLMEINAAYGSRLLETPFDFDASGNFGSGDYLQFAGQNVVGSGIRRTGAGRFSAPAVLNDPTNGGRREKKVSTSSDGGIIVEDESAGRRGLGRRSWRQILAD